MADCLPLTSIFRTLRIKYQISCCTFFLRGFARPGKRKNCIAGRTIGSQNASNNSKSFTALAFCCPLIGAEAETPKFDSSSIAP